MFKHYIKIMLRILVREKSYAVINILGLSLGMACCVILVLHIRNELTYDRHFDKHQRIYRVVGEYTFSGVASRTAETSRALGPLLQIDNPDVIQAYTRFQPVNPGKRTLFRTEDASAYWENVYFADTNVFAVFSHDVIYGDPQEALSSPASIAVSESFARSYFGDENPMGKILATDTSQYEIALVFADLPAATHLKYDVLVSMNQLGTFPDNPAELQRMLGDIANYTYVLVPERFAANSFDTIFRNFQTERIEALIREFNLEDVNVRHWAQNLGDIHFDSALDRDQPTGNILSVYAFAGVAAFILIIACINYVNLATARSIHRAKEVAMRKVLGAERRQLVFQFLAESLFFALLALIISVSLIEWSIRYNLLENLPGLNLNVSTVYGANLLAWILGLGLAVGVVSGLYPAFYLSAVVPTRALSGGSESPHGGSGRLRKLLVFVQFAISVGIVASTLLMLNQMQFVADMPLGFNRENKLLVALNGADVVESLPAIRNEMALNPNIQAVSSAQHVPAGQTEVSAFYFRNSSGAMEPQSVSEMVVGDDFLETMGMQMRVGRYFSEEVATDVDSMIINEALMERMGWSEDEAIGKFVENSRGRTEGQIIGVVENFHFASLRQLVSPVVLTLADDNFENLSTARRSGISRTLVLDVAAENISETIEYVRALMLKFDPGHPFEFEFLDRRLDALYRSDVNVLASTAIFSGICIFISCLGVFGLSSYTTERRSKEIGIRKVLGASDSQVLNLLSRGILFQILAGAVVGSIVSFYAINEWLQGFAYRDSINTATFLAATLAALAVAFATIVMQSLKTLCRRPVEALR